MFWKRGRGSDVLEEGEGERCFGRGGGIVTFWKRGRGSDVLEEGKG